MTFYEYHVAPAPRKGSNAKGVKGGAAKFANAITELMNAMAADGWEYLRADTLPCEERQGLTGKAVKYHSMLVFRRALTLEETDEAPLALPVPQDAPQQEEVEQQVTEHEEEYQSEPEPHEDPVEPVEDPDAPDRTPA